MVVLFLKLVASIIVCIFNFYAANYIYHEKSGFRKAGLLMLVFLTMFLLARIVSVMPVPARFSEVPPLSFMGLLATVMFNLLVTTHKRMSEGYAINHPKFYKGFYKFADVF
jgi:hypothetical protein